MITYPNLYHLQYFADAVELGSVSAAAQKNLVTHPAVSRAISALEKHMGVPLLEHRKKSFQVTEAGYQTAEHARSLLVQAARFKKMSPVDESSFSGKVSIGLSRSLSSLYLVPLVQKLKKKFPGFQAQVRFGTTNEIIQAVAREELDLALTIGTLDLPSLRQSVIRQGEFGLVEVAGLENHRDSFENKSFLITEPRFETERLRQAYQKKFGKPLPMLSEISSWDVIGQLVLQGLGIGLLPDVVFQSWKKSSYRLHRPGWFACDFQIHLHHLKSSPQSRVHQAALEIVKTE